MAMSTGSGSDLRWRRLTRSITTTRGSKRTRSATCRAAQRLVLTQAPRGTRLAVAHVDAVHPGGAALQQAVGEAAGGQPSVERHKPRHINAESVQRSLQLVARAAHVPARARVRASERERAVGNALWVLGCDLNNRCGGHGKASLALRRAVHQHLALRRPSAPRGGCGWVRGERACRIQDWMSVRLYCGCCSIASASRRSLLFFTLASGGGGAAAEAAGASLEASAALATAPPRPLSLGGAGAALREAPRTPRHGCSSATARARCTRCITRCMCAQHGRPLICERAGGLRCCCANASCSPKLFWSRKRAEK